MGRACFILGLLAARWVQGFVVRQPHHVNNSCRRTNDKCKPLNAYLEEEDEEYYYSGSDPFFPETAGSVTSPSSPSATTDPFSFSNFVFAENGVCVQPQYFATARNTAELSTSSVSSPHVFTMRNVPGNGDCMFLAVALATLASVGLGGNDTLLNAIAQETRQLVATILQQTDGYLVVDVRQGKPVVVSTQALLKQATQQEGFLSISEYLQALTTPGEQGGLYGGGPELTVLANALRRPISIYEVSSSASPLSPDALLENMARGAITCPIECVGTFGNMIFDDPLLSIPQSAVLQVSHGPDGPPTPALPGAYSWHLHILVVETDYPGEKHACVLLPQPIE